MKLVELKLNRPVRIKNIETHYINNARADQTTIEMSFDQGLISIVMPEKTYLVGLANVEFMVPAEEKTKKVAAK